MVAGSTHYIGQFMVTTLGLIGILWLVSVFLQQKLGKLPGVSSFKAKHNPLKLEASLRLEARKTLYVVRHGDQRFLLASHGDKTELLSPLEAIAAPETVTEGVLEPDSDAPEQAPAIPSGFWERLRLSVEMIAAERFSPTGGR